MARETYGAAKAVAYPDHPLLARGPDILGQDNHGLVAEFVYGDSSEIPTAKRESVRVLLARLALPKGTRFVMRLIGDNPPIGGGSVLFDELLISSRRGHVERELLGNDASELTDVIRPFHFERFTEAWTRPVAGADRRARVGRSTFSRSTPELSRRPSWLDADEEGIVARIDRSDRSRSVLPKVQTLATATTFYDYGLRDGLVGLQETAQLLAGRVSHLALHTLTLDQHLDHARRSGDPLKAYRAAAFAGAEVKYPEIS